MRRAKDCGTASISHVKPEARLFSYSNVWFNRHAGPQQVEALLIGFEADSHRDSLHHLDVIASGVLGRKDACHGARRATDGFDVSFEISLQCIDMDRCGLLGPNRS